MSTQGTLPVLDQKYNGSVAQRGQQCSPSMKRWGLEPPERLRPGTFEGRGTTVNLVERHSYERATMTSCRIAFIAGAMVPKIAPEIAIAPAIGHHR